MHSDDSKAEEEFQDAARLGWNFDNSYVRLPDALYQRVRPEPVDQPSSVITNSALAVEMGLNAGALAHPESTRVFAGNLIPKGADPIAQAYAGHQFGHLTMLGDGRAILLGEHVADKRWDIQLKGSGRTPYSRRGDGRAALGPMLREYIIGEAMHALGIPTTRILAVVSSGEAVFRESELPGAVLTRVADSHIRVGTFEYASRIGEPEVLSALITYSIERHQPDAADQRNPVLAFLEGVAEKQARLVAQWLNVGFIHGVMNTDNMAVSGETIDYGPCAFMDAYDPATVFSSIDRNGRYAYGNQPSIAQWNIARFAETLVSQLSENESEGLELAKNVVEAFPERFRNFWLDGMRKKLGLASPKEDDAALIQSLLEWMQDTGADFTNTFAALDPTSGLPAFDDPRFLEWQRRWQQRLDNPEESLALMQGANPAVVPRNHKVEEALEAAVQRGDLRPTRRLLEVLADPYDRTQNREGFATPRPKDLPPYQTFCGT